MCYFLTIAVPSEHVATLKRYVPPGSLSLNGQSNRTILSQLEGHYDTFTLTSGRCSCPLFADAAGPPDVAAFKADLRKRYEKKGWPYLRIERAITAALEHKQALPFRGLRPDVRDLLADAVDELGTVLFLVHDYDEDSETESVPVRRKSAISVDELRSGETEVAVDTLYRVRRG